ncbi:Putative RAM signaling pathway, SOG2, leucine-rich repeat domain superfamily [Septoria linicola]|uniref:RAM signaling pathway, SOG2, leucine-rich repeat domain superfamily n=1 Tax=Septoria linicola TaxID=215465 RepID=A0A9Q9B7P2_9PEZI|nr:Putative RAM signaling pathway, SOG2, leucine-rich repeat domain superfamily [Septoria linicola]
MADSTTNSTLVPRAPMTSEELVEFVKNELDAEQQRQANAAALTAGALPTDQQTGSTLDLSHCNISALPAEVILLIKDRVERLALSHNRNIQLAPEIVQCDRLRYLNLRWNKLRAFPEAVLSLPKLEILDISKNTIESIPEDIKKMTNLKFLAVARNQITRLPLAIGEMNLVKLKFDENPIEFPPPEALKPSTLSSVESEKDKDMCQQVKRFMKTAAMRQRLRTDSSEDLSSADTPRPPRRVVTGGRFPVRPSVSGIENVEGLAKSESPPNVAPPIPMRSHARGASSTAAHPNIIKRPGIAPLLTSALDVSRSRSESITTPANIRNRRQGYVPHKHTNLNSLDEMSTRMSTRTSQASTLTPPHSRAPSVNSAYLGISGGESSSGAVSPIDGPLSRAILSRKLSSLPESRNSTVPMQNSIRAVKRVLFMLFYVHRPLADIAQQFGSGSPRRSTLERQLATANFKVDELDRLIHKANQMVEDNMEVDNRTLMQIVRTAILALRSYVFVIKELNRNRQQCVKRVDAYHVRQVITSVYNLIMEARNVCNLLGFKTVTANPRDTLRASQAWSSRTVTPTQSKPAAGPRRRGATILPSSSSVTNLRGMAPPVPLHTPSSRSNTMTSVGGSATPRWNQSFSDLASMTHSRGPSRSNTIRSATGSDAEETADRVYIKLKNCCDLARATLPPVRDDLASRKSVEDRAGNLRQASLFGAAINKCDLAVTTNNRLLARLRIMRVGDPARYQHEFRQMAEQFAKDWAEFAAEIMRLTREGLDIGNIKNHLKPVQHACRDVDRAAKIVTPPSNRPPPSGGLHNAFPTALNTALNQHIAMGFAPPVPATPLGAALGPAVQATVPPTPTTATNIPDYSFPPVPPIPANIPPPSHVGMRRAPNLPMPSYPRLGPLTHLPSNPQ